LVGAALRGLGRLTGRRTRDAAAIPATATAMAHATLLHKFDAHLTRLQKLAGDPADILHTGRWQAALYPRLLQLQGHAFVAPLAERSEAFARAYLARQVGNGEYPRFIQEQWASVRETARALAGAGLQFEAELAEMERALASPGALQKA